MNEIASMLQAIAAVVAAVGGIGGGIVFAVKAIQQWNKANEERRKENEERKKANEEQKRANEERNRELRWKQAEEGRRLLDDLLVNDKHLGYKALVMIDLRDGEPAVEFEDSWIKSKIQIHDITYKDVMHALTKDADSEKAAFIQACFDDLFYYLDRIGHFLTEGFLKPDDVRCPLDYYAEQMAKTPKLKGTYEGYIRETRAQRALQLLEKLEGWGVPGGGLALDLAAANQPPG